MAIDTGHDAGLWIRFIVPRIGLAIQVIFLIRGEDMSALESRYRMCNAEINEHDCYRASRRRSQRWNRVPVIKLGIPRSCIGTDVVCGCQNIERIACTRKCVVSTRVSMDDFPVTIEARGAIALLPPNKLVTRIQRDTRCISAKLIRVSIIYTNCTSLTGMDKPRVERDGWYPKGADAVILKGTLIGAFKMSKENHIPNASHAAIREVQKEALSSLISIWVPKCVAD